MSKKSDDKNGSTFKGVIFTLLVVLAAFGIYFLFDMFKNMG